jgi:formate dehydrogenase major subunit
MPVMQPSAWQQEYSRFNQTQQALLTAAARDEATLGAK